MWILLIVPSRATECEISLGEVPSIPPEFPREALLEAVDENSDPRIGDRFVDFWRHLRRYGDLLTGPFLLRRAPP